MYTKEQLEEAKDYIRRRLNNELSMEHDIDSLLTEYAVYLVELMVDGEDYEFLIEDLIERILADCYLLGVDEREEHRSGIMAYMNSIRGGSTLEERVRERCRTFAEEVEATVLAGITLDKSRDEILDAVLSDMKHPWDNAILTEARDLRQSGSKTFESQIDAPSFGRGVEISSSGALKTITAYAIADAWMFDLHFTHKDATGYYVVRGSSYPCDECDEAAHTGPHPMDDWTHFTPLHPHCVCAVVFV